MYAYTHVYVTIIKEEMDLRGSVRDTNGAGRKKGIDDINKIFCMKFSKT